MCTIKIKLCNSRALLKTCIRCHPTVCNVILFISYKYCIKICANMSEIKTINELKKNIFNSNTDASTKYETTPEIVDK